MTGNEKILVTYATRCGSTAGVAQAIAQIFSDRNIAVDVCPIQDVSGINAYRAVIIGSAVRIGRWLPEAVKFVEQNRQSLSSVPTAFFAVHLMNMGEDEPSRIARRAYLDPARKWVTPAAEAFFPGAGDMKKMSFMERMLSKAVKSPEGDFRNWQLIRAWAEDLRQNVLSVA